MKLCEIFVADNVVEDLGAASKAEVIRTLVQAMCNSGSLDAAEAKKVGVALSRREKLGSTGIGRGVAVPHAKQSGVKGVVGALGRSREGVDFDALDGQPVYLVFMLVSSPDAVELHLEALKKVTMLLRDDDFCTFFKRAKDKAELVELLGEAEERLARMQGPGSRGL